MSPTAYDAAFLSSNRRAPFGTSGDTAALLTSIDSTCELSAKPARSTASLNSLCRSSSRGWAASAAFSSANCLAASAFLCAASACSRSSRTAAQLIGTGQALLDAAVDYAKQRAQFGRVIGSYQAIKHKLADVHIALELARPLVYGAALSLADRSADTARDVSAAKASASDAALLAARSALQTHGAIGFTAEHDLSLWLLRVQALRSAWGDPATHRRRVLEAL